jgi:hypothetical protein
LGAALVFGLDFDAALLADWVRRKLP